MPLVTLALKTLLSISQNGISPITLNKQLGNHFNNDIISPIRKWKNTFSEFSFIIEGPLQRYSKF
jgi:hypothetical protein